MNILLIDTALPSSVFSGKTVRLKNVYGRLAKDHSIVYVRTARLGSVTESKELESWAQTTFKTCARLLPLRKPQIVNQFLTVLKLKPWYDITSKFPESMGTIKKELMDLARQYQIDTVITFDQEAAPYGMILAQEYPWIQDLGDSMTLQMRRQIQRSDMKKQWALKWRLMRETKYEHEMIGRAKHNIFVAEDDASLHRNGTELSIEVIPNGVDTDYFNPDRISGIRSTKPYVVFTGHMSFKPNQDAVTYFAHEILPLVRKELPELEFKIVGADPFIEVRELAYIFGVEVTGQVPDVRPYLKNAKAFVCSMNMGSGIKNKILEALAMKIPIISSSTALKGIENYPTHIKIAEGSKEFAQEVVNSVKTGLTGAQLEEGRRFVEERYSWNRTVSRYQNLFSHLMEK